MATPLEIGQIQSDLRHIRQDLESVKTRLEQVAQVVERPTPTEHPHIVRKPGPRGGEPIIRDTALTVRTIVQRVHIGESPEQIAEIFPVLTLAQVYAALSYYHEHPAEIERRKPYAPKPQRHRPKNRPHRQRIRLERPHPLRRGGGRGI